MTDAPLAGAPWLTSAAATAILAALAGGGAETRFVGGVVRDGLLGRALADIDFATTLPPDESARRLADAGLKTAPTGLAHGTITAIVDGRGYEITTLRRDVATDGRHATVAFTDDWREDAARRDFTINAMSADASGRIYDYFGGQDDLKAGRVRFVGDADARVSEDYLRILRFFRFHAWYGAGPADPAALAACAGGVDGLDRVSAERVRVELLRLLAAPDPRLALVAMRSAGVLAAVLGAETHDIGPLIAQEGAGAAAPDPVLRLAALRPNAGAALAERLRLSNAEAAALRALEPAPPNLGENGAAWRRALHQDGAEAFRRKALLAAAAGEVAELNARLAAAAAWTPKTLPVVGGDLIALGLTRGPAVGAMLRALEDAWIDRDFCPGKAELLAMAKAKMSAKGDEA